MGRKASPGALSVEYDSAFTKDEILMYDMAWIELQVTML